LTNPPRQPVPFVEIGYTLLYLMEIGYTIYTINIQIQNTNISSMVYVLLVTTNSSQATPDLTCTHRNIRPVAEETHHQDCPLYNDMTPSLGVLGCNTTYHTHSNTNLPADDIYLHSKEKSIKRQRQFVSQQHI